MTTETTATSRIPEARPCQGNVPPRNAPWRLTVAVAAVLLTACTSSAEPRPNVVLVVLDDARADDLRFLPSVQELAARGTSFQRAFAPFSLCTPSRASLLSGNTPAVHGIRDNHGQNFDASSTLAVWLQNAGFRTGLVGKYLNKAPHTGWPKPPGWEVWMPIHRHDDYGRDQANVLLSQSVEFIADQDPRPFFLLLAPAGPHGPSRGPAGICDGPFPPLPEPLNFDPRYEGSTLETKRWPQRLSSLCGIDLLIAGVVSALERQGVLENTLLIITSDQGYHLGEHSEVGKQTLYEEVVRVPLVVSGPGFDTRSSNQIVSLVDVAPTVAELSGASYPEVEGRSILTGAERNYAPIEARGCTGKRRAHTKVTWCGAVTRTFDLANDPFEMTPTVSGAK